MDMTSKSNKTAGLSTRTWSMIVNVGLLLVVVGILLPMFGVSRLTYRWIYAAGALISLLGRFGTQYGGPELRLRRLTRIEMWASVFFFVAAFFMFYPGAQGSDWLAFTIAGGAILIYTSIMIPRETSKSRRG